MPKVLVAGATSVVGEAALEYFASLDGWNVVGVSRRDRRVPGTNGDVFTMRGVWPAIAAALDMEVGDEVSQSLATSMPAREPEWAELFERFQRERLLP